MFAFNLIWNNNNNCIAFSAKISQSTVNVLAQSWACRTRVFTFLFSIKDEQEIIGLVYIQSSCLVGSEWFTEDLLMTESFSLSTFCKYWIPLRLCKRIVTFFLVNTLCDISYAEKKFCFGSNDLSPWLVGPSYV